MSKWLDIQRNGLDRWREWRLLWGRRMKMTKIETLVVHARMRNWVLVKVATNQPGLYGWGEAPLEWKTKSKEVF